MMWDDPPSHITIIFFTVSHVELLIRTAFAVSSSGRPLCSNVDTTILSADLVSTICLVDQNALWDAPVNKSTRGSIENTDFSLDRGKEHKRQNSRRVIPLWDRLQLN